jgi:hypothetical protein
VDLAKIFGDAAVSGLSVAQIAAEANLSDDMVRRHLALLRLTEPVARLVSSGRLPVHQAELVSRVGDPAGQIRLAEGATRLAWDAKGAGWAARGRMEWRSVHGRYWMVARPGDAEQKVSDRDYVQPMDGLREEVARAMRGLAACGWLGQEEEFDDPFRPIAGRGRCVGCPDNTATYADQPMLFAGIEPRGSAKKGHCTNAACYEGKAAAWEKFRILRAKQEEKTLAKKIEKAKKSGLVVCEECGGLMGVKKVGRRQLCERHAAKAQKAAEAAAAGWIGTPENKHRPFPQTLPEKYSVDLRLYGCRLVSALQDFVVKDLKGRSSMQVDRLFSWGAALVSLMDPVGVYINLDSSAIKEPDAMRRLCEMASFGSDYAPPMPTQLVEEIWGELDLDAFRPELNYKGEVENVPLPPRCAALIDVLEMLCRRWGVKINPQRPKETVAASTTESTEDTENGEKKGTRAKGPGTSKKSGPPKIEDPRQGLQGQASGTPAKMETIEIPNVPCNRSCDGCPVQCDVSDEQRKRIMPTIVGGKRPKALAAIQRCTDLAGLQTIEAKGLLKGDWRRAAVSRRIMDLRIDEDMAAEGAALGEKAEAKA